MYLIEIVSSGLGGSVSTVSTTAKCLVAALLAAIFLSACTSAIGDASSTTSSSQLDTYREELEPILERAQGLEKRYAAVAGENYKTDMKVYRTVLKVLPEFNLVIEDASAISVDDDAVMEAHELLLDALAKEGKAFALLIGAIETQDFAQIAAANEAFAEGHKLIREYVRELGRLEDASNQ
jgi:hypothetical protein